MKQIHSGGNTAAAAAADGADYDADYDEVLIPYHLQLAESPRNEVVVGVELAVANCAKGRESRA